jgi:hypothetical protein
VVSKVAANLVTFFGPAHKVSGKSMFVENHVAEIKTNMKTQIHSLNLPTQHNLKYQHEALDEIWNRLTATEK